NSAPAQNAVNATTGFFADGTKSFWSAVDDGPKVTLGGAANVLPDPANRTVYTDLTSGTLNVAGNKVLDGNSAITATMVGLPATATAAERTAQINWIRGADADDSDATDDKVLLFFGQGRGGSNYYALDVTDENNPKLMWKHGGSSGDNTFVGLGQSWST